MYFYILRVIKVIYSRRKYTIINICQNYSLKIETLIFQFFNFYEDIPVTWTFPLRF